MFLQKKVKDEEVHELAKLCWTMKNMSTISTLRGIRISCQGYHPVTSGTSVVDWNLKHVKSLVDAKRCIHSVLFGYHFPGKQDFIDRVERKVVGGGMHVVSRCLEMISTATAYAMNTKQTKSNL